LAAAEGNSKKIIKAEKNKADALKAIQKDLDSLKTAQKQETTEAKKQGDTKFEDDLNNLKLKGDQDLAKGKEKIQLEVNARYKKLLEENLGDEQRTAEIKKQISEELSAKQLQLSKDTAKKVADDAISLAKGAVDGLAAIFSMQTDAENQQLKEDEEANNKKKANLQAQLDAKLITKEQYDSQVSRMDKDLDKKRKKMEHDQAVRKQRSGLVQCLDQCCNGGCFSSRSRSWSWDRTLYHYCCFGSNPNRIYPEPESSGSRYWPLFGDRPAG